MKKHSGTGIGKRAVRAGAVLLLVCGGVFLYHAFHADSVIFHPEAFLGAAAFRENQVIFPEQEEAAGQGGSGENDSDLWEKDEDAEEEGKPEDGDDTDTKFEEQQPQPLPDEPEILSEPEHFDEQLPGPDPGPDLMQENTAEQPEEWSKDRSAEQAEEQPEPAGGDDDSDGDDSSGGVQLRIPASQSVGIAVSDSNKSSGSGNTVLSVIVEASSGGSGGSGVSGAGAGGLSGQTVVSGGTTGRAEQTVPDTSSVPATSDTTVTPAAPAASDTTPAGTDASTVPDTPAAPVTPAVVPVVDTPEPSAEPESNITPSQNMDSYDLEKKVTEVTEEGVPMVSEDGTAVTYTADFREANINYLPESAIYYSCPLSPYRLFCGTYATLIGSDGMKYVFENYDENLIKVTGEYPAVASGPFETEFSYRLSTDSEWQTVTVSYSVCPYKVSLRSYEEAETYVGNYCLDDRGLDGTESVSYLFVPYLNDDIISEDCLEGSSSDTWRKMTEYFPGWTETADGSGGVLTDYYIPANKGWTVLYPEKMQEVPEGLTILYGYWNFDEEEYAAPAQVLAANPCCSCGECWLCLYGYADVCSCCDSCAAAAEGPVVLEVPEGIQVICGMSEGYWDYDENEYAITADRLIVPATVLDIRSVTVRQSYEVDEDNPVYSSENGLLMDKDKTKVLAIPTELAEVHIPETAASVELLEVSYWDPYSITDIYFTSETPPEIDMERLSQISQIHLPTAELYNTYLIAWGTSLPAGTLVCDAGTDGTAEWMDDGRILVKDGAILMVNPDVAGAYIVPDDIGITSIAEGALDSCSRLTTLVLPDTIVTVESGALAGESLKYVFFTGETVPQVADDAFLTAGVPASSVLIQVPDGMTEVYRKTWTEAGSDTVADMLAQDPMTLVQDENGLVFGVCGTEAVLFGITDGTLAIFDGNSCASVDGAVLTEIEDYAFAGLDDLTLVVVPETVERIGAGAFADCTALDGVMVYSGTLLLGDDPFDGCDNLRFVAFNTLTFDAEGDAGLAIPSLLYVRSDAENAPVNEEYDTFLTDGSMWLQEETNSGGSYLCTGESGAVTLLHATADVSGELSLPDGTTAIGTEAFCGCNNQFWILPEDFAEVRAAGLYAFQSSGFSGIDESGTLDLSGMSSVEAYAFSICGNLTSVNLGEQLTVLPEGLFWDCPSLETVPDLSYVTYIGDYAFQSCTGMGGTPVFSDGLMYVGTEAFAYCPLTGNLVFGDSLTEISLGAFYECTEITGVSLPAAEIIGNYAFYDCWQMIKAEMPAAGYIGEMAFYGCSYLEELSMPEVEYISYAAFYGCSGLTGTLMLGENLQYIGLYAFSTCLGLESVEIEGPLTGDSLFCVDGEAGIDGDAFEYCTNLKSVVFGDDVAFTTLSYEAFTNTAITEFTVPDSVTLLEQQVFTGCESLEKVIFEGDFPPELDTAYTGGVYLFGFEPDDGDFSSIRGILEVPEGSEDDYVGDWSIAFEDTVLDEGDERTLSGINNVRLMLGLDPLDSLEDAAEEMSIDIIMLGADPDILDEDIITASPSNWTKSAAAGVATASNWTKNMETATASDWTYTETEEDGDEDENTGNAAETASPSNWSGSRPAGSAGENEASGSDSRTGVPYKKEEDIAYLPSAAAAENEAEDEENV